MEQFDDFLKPENIKHFNDYQVNQYTCYMRIEITDFLYNTFNTIETQTKKQEFYDIDNFFKKNNITDPTQISNIKQNIYSELQNLGWSLATIFGDTALLIKPTKEAIEKSIWGNTIDIKYIN